MVERRRWPRRQVAWSVAMTIDGGPSITAAAVDASLYGLRLAVPAGADLSAIKHGTRCKVEVHLCGAAARFERVCEVRYLGPDGVGLLFADPLPAALAPAGGAENPRTAKAAAKPRVSPAIALMSKLRSVALAPLQH